MKLGIYTSARRHGVADADIRHAVMHALVAAEDEEARVLYLGPDRAANMLEIVTIMREDGTEVAIHAMRMRRRYASLLDDLRERDG